MNAAPRISIWRFFLIALICVALGSGLAAEEPAPAGDVAEDSTAASAGDGLDGLFEEPSGAQDGQAADDADAGASVLDRLDEKKGIKLRGSFSSAAGITLGWEDIPDFSDLSSGFIVNPGASLEALLNFDASPDPDFSFHAQAGARLASDISLSEFFLRECFADVSLGDIALLRVGKSRVAWGNGRIFSPANLASYASETVNARLAFPTFLGGLAGIVAANPSLYETPSLEMLYSAGKLDLILGRVSLSLMGGAQMNLGARAAASLKTVLFGVDIMGEACVGYRDAGGPVYFPSAMAGFFKEWKDAGIILNAEYLFDSESYFLWVADPFSYAKAGYNHAACLQFAWANILGDLDFGFRWAHSFTQLSGTAQAAVSYPAWRHVKLSFAIPLNYGVDSAYYQEKFEEDDKRASFLSSFGFGAGFGIGVQAEF